MTEYDNNNKGAIWGNDRKEKDTQPDFTGECLIDGVEYRMAAWKRAPDSKPGTPSLKFQFTNKAEFEAKKQNAPQQAPAPATDDFDSDIPF